MCKFDEAWVGKCRSQNLEGSEFCEKHSKTKCCVCAEQATNECSHTGQFVCGAPLCDNCQGYTDTSKGSGVWGFMNHGHRRKETSNAKVSGRPHHETEKE